MILGRLLVYLVAWLLALAQLISIKNSIFEMVPVLDGFLHLVLLYQLVKGIHGLGNGLVHVGGGGLGYMGNALLDQLRSFGFRIDTHVFGNGSIPRENNMNDDYDDCV